LYAIEFTDWGEWLAMKIEQESLSEYSELDIIGHYLWEMTFYGFTQEKIKKQLAHLEKEAEETKKNPSSCIFPFAEETKSFPMPTVNI